MRDILYESSTSQIFMCPRQVGNARFPVELDYISSVKIPNEFSSFSEHL